MKRINIDNILFLIFMAVVPTVLVIITSFIFLFLPKETNEVVQSLIVLPFSFIIVPIVILFRQEKVELRELGIRKLAKKDVMISIACNLVLYIFLFYNILIP